MNINLFIYYQLSTSNELPVLSAIKKLGNTTRLANGFWYVNSSFSASEALKIISSWLTEQDSVVVIDTVANECVWFNLTELQAQRIRQNWSMPLAADQPDESKPDAIEPTKAVSEETAH